MSKLTENLHTEGERASQDLALLAEKIGYGGFPNQLQCSNGAFISSILNMIEDNSGLVEIMFEWVEEHYGDKFEDEDYDDDDCEDDCQDSFQISNEQRDQLKLSVDDMVVDGIDWDFIISARDLAKINKSVFNIMNKWRLNKSDRSNSIKILSEIISSFK